MKKRSKEILDLLARRENDHTISTLAAKFEVSERTIRNDIKEISMTTSKNKRSNRSVLEVTA